VGFTLQMVLRLDAALDERRLKGGVWRAARQRGEQRDAQAK
jgi:hypothetical protein